MECEYLPIIGTTLLCVHNARLILISQKQPLKLHLNIRKMAFVMRIKSASIKGYRTIKEEVAFDMDGVVTLVGPNNSGKTNTLKALQIFFTGYDNDLSYDFDHDMCKGEKSLRTNIQIVLSDVSEDSDGELLEIIRNIRKSLEVATGNESEITLYLTFSPNSNPVYRVYPNSKRPTGSDGVAYSRLERRLFEHFLGKLSIHYIPSEKSIAELYKTLVLPFLLKKMHTTLVPYISNIVDALNQTASDINSTLLEAGLGIYNASFELPSSPEKIFGNVEFNLKDDNITSIFSKGMGVQSAVLLSAFCWIAKQEKENGKLSLWLIEEPESYLHPQLATQCLSLLRILGERAQVVMTTHSLGFVPHSPDRTIGITLEDGWTTATKFKTYVDATKSIRSSLGVKFSDYYNFSEYNLLVEGQTDRDYINIVLDSIKGNDELQDKFPILLSGKLGIHDFGGTKGLEGFLRATYEFITAERASVSMLDGDDAGDRTRRDLQSFFGNKGTPFESNKDYIIIRDRFTIEGLLPDDWIKEIHGQHPGWFENYAEDTQGKILPFRLKNGNKDQYLNWFRSKISNTTFDDWADRWLPVLTAIEHSFSDQGKRLYGK